MIHSLAGGSFREKRVVDFAKVEISSGVLKGNCFWYVLPSRNFDVGDSVVVPLGKNNAKSDGVIVRIDLSVVEGQTPVPLKIAKEIIRKK